MNVLSVLQRVKAGSTVLVTLPCRDGHDKTYSLSDGTAVSRSQFTKIKPFLAPMDAGLLPDSEPQTYKWSG